MRRVTVLVAAVGMLAAGCSSGTSDTTLVTTTSTVSTTVPSTTTTSQAITTTAVPSTTTTTAATTTVASAPVEAKYPVVVTSGLSGEDTQEIMMWAPGGGRLLARRVRPPRNGRQRAEPCRDGHRPGRSRCRRVRHRLSLGVDLDTAMAGRPTGTLNADTATPAALLPTTGATSTSR